jgi:hypothetical protein
VYPALAVLVGAALSAVGAVSAGGSTTDPAGTNAGPPYQFTTELMGEGAGTALKDQVELTRTKLGYRYWTGQQNNHIVVTLVDGGLKFRDTGTERFKKLAAACQRQKVKVGISAVCRIPSDITVAKPLLVEVWPRLGNDYLNTSALPATYAVTFLSDEGNDTAYFGAGPDFFNGYMGHDRAFGGGGNDWIRGGLGNDEVHGGAGNDDIVAETGADNVHSGEGDDRVWGSDGDDRIWGGAGADFIYCGDGSDSATVDAADQFFPNCESVNHV